MATALNLDRVPDLPISLDRYHSLIETGVLGPDHRVELLDGSLVSKMSKNPAYRLSTRRTRRALEQIVPQGVVCGRSGTDYTPQPICHW